MIIRLLVSAANFGACFTGNLEGNISENIPTTLSMPPGSTVETTYEIVSNYSSLVLRLKRNFEFPLFL